MPEEPANVNLTSALPDDVREAAAASVFLDNAKATAGQGAALSNLMLQDAINFSKLTWQNAAAIQLAAQRNLVEMTPSESVAEQKVLSGNDLAQQLAQLQSMLGSLIPAMQAAAKGSGNIPPVTP